MMARKVPFDPFVYFEEILAILLGCGTGLLDPLLKMIADWTVDRRTLRPFYTHQWLYVKDTDDNWLEARIKRIMPPNRESREGLVHIHYVGWKEKYDEFLSFLDFVNPKSKLSIERLRPYQAEFQLMKPIVYPHFLSAMFLNDILRRKGELLEVLDSLDKWLPATVVDYAEFPDGPMVKVHYVAWHKNYDDWIPVESYRLAPAGTQH